ncbi:hypothetical protein SLA2020_270770 [Shorea laevis]
MRQQMSLSVLFVNNLIQDETVDELLGVPYMQTRLDEIVDELLKAPFGVLYNSCPNDLVPSFGCPCL